MRRYLPALLFVAVVVYSLRGFRGCPTGGVTSAPLQLGDEPVQVELDKPEPVTIERDGKTFHIQKTHSYRVVGEVLSASTYSLAFTNEFYDVDIGLAWGDHVPALKDAYTFYQDHRWLFWRADHPVSDADRADVGTHIGNQHIIPAEGHPRIDRAVRWAREGDIVALEGYLVASLDSSWQPLAKSSTSRSDTGNGACEIVWVEKFQNGGTTWQ